MNGRVIDTYGPYSFDNHFVSLIEGKIIKRQKAGEGYEEVFQKNASFADVEILSILRMGQNYHGQFNKGDTLRIFFNFTLENTHYISFTSIDKHLPGLKENEIFKAELNESEDVNRKYSVYLYELMDSK